MRTRSVLHHVPRRTPLFGLVAVVALLVASRAEASPIFARRYNVSCQTCHGPAYPELNALGRQFKENGYQFPAGAEAAYRDQDTYAPGTVGERIGLMRELPLAARLTGYVEVPTDAAASGRNTVNLKLLQQLYLMGGGSLYEDVSVFFSTSIAPKPMLHHAAIGLHNVLGDGYLNLRAGQILLLDYLRPEHRALDRGGNPAAMVQVGLNPTTLDSSQLGVSAYGRALDRQLFYEVAVVQGAQGADGTSDLDSNKDVFAQLQYTFNDENHVGVHGYVGRTQISSDARSVAVRFTDRMWIAGASLQYHLGPLILFGHALYGDHDDPYGDGDRARYLGGRADLTASITPELLARVRYDQVSSKDDASLDRRLAGAHVTYLVLTNFKLSAELAADLDAFEKSTVFVMLDVAL